VIGRPVHSLTPARSCMLPANAAAEDVFALSIIQNTHSLYYSNYSQVIFNQTIFSSSSETRQMMAMTSLSTTCHLSQL